MLNALVPVLKKLFQQGGKIAVKAATSKIVKKIGQDIATEVVSSTAKVAVNKIFNDKSMSFKNKLKELDELKNERVITNDEYKKLRDKLIDAQ